MPDILKMAKEDMKAYGEEVLKERAIPDFRDGLKPVHRRILWTMYSMGLKHSGGTKKSAKIVGDAMARFHPHGDQSIYQTLVGMTHTGCPEPMVYGQGNFGNIEDGPAAMRYTEVKLTKFSDKYLLDPDYIAVTPMVLNYDDTEMEPAFLPSKIPGPLVFGTEGIAVGCSNYLPSFSLESVIDLVVDALSGEEINADLFIKNLRFKFTYGGRCSSSKRAIKEYFETGFARLNYACKLAEGKKDRQYYIESMAPRIKPTKLEVQLSNIKGIKSFDLIHSRTEPRWFQITLKKSADEEEVLKQIKRITRVPLNLQTYMTERHGDKQVTFKKTNLVQVLKDWIDWRIDFEGLVVNRLIGIEERQIQRYDWLIWACNHLKIIMKALESKNPDKYLIKNGPIEPEGADFILSQQVRRLAKLEIEGLAAKKGREGKEIQVLE